MEPCPRSILGGIKATFRSANTLFFFLIDFACSVTLDRIENKRKETGFVFGVE